LKELWPIRADLALVGEPPGTSLQSWRVHWLHVCQLGSSRYWSRRVPIGAAADHRRGLCLSLGSSVAVRCPPCGPRA